MDYTAVIKKITPSKKEIEDMEMTTNIVLGKISEELKKAKFDISPVWVGSTARNTWLSGKNEIDIFIPFSKKINRENLEKIGLGIGEKVGKSLGKHKVAYAEHPYTQAFFGKYKIDIVPCYSIKKGENIISAVDRSILHNEYMSTNVKSEKLRAEIRLFKQWVKNQGVYGSDGVVEGLSGYVCELLVINFGNFEKTVQAIGKWKPGEVINCGNFYSESNFKNLRKMFKDHPLIVIDPVDKTRNASASLSKKNFGVLVHIAQEFLKNPSEKFFFWEKIKILNESDINRKLKERGTKFLFLSFNTPEIMDVILWPQLRRSSENLKKAVEEKGFKLINTLVWAGAEKTVIGLEFEVWELSKIKKIFGPFVWLDRKHKIKFSKNNAFRTGIDDYRLFAEVARKYTAVESFLKDFLKKDLKEKGFGSYIAAEAEKKHTLEENIPKDEEFREFMSRWLKGE